MTAEEVHALLNAACDLLNRPESSRRDWWIFQQALGDTPEVHQTLGAFLKDVTTCPPGVIVFCQQLLAPKTQPARAA